MSQTENPNIKIAVAYYREAPLITGDIYLPIQTGKANNPDLDLKIQPDNEGDNISKDNFLVSELSATYWLWKNVKADYKGLFHNRRILSNRRCLNTPIKLLLSFYPRHPYRFNLKPYQKDYSLKTFMSESSLTEQYLKKIITSYDIITTRQVKAKKIARSYFTEYGCGNSLIDLMEETIKETYPHYFNISMKCLDEKDFYFGNMIIMKNSLFNEYCDFIFQIFFKMKENLTINKILNESTLDMNFYRKFGYIGEILTNIFIKSGIQRGLKIKEMAVIRY